MLGVETKKDPIYAKIEQLSIQEKLRLEKPLGILDKPIPIKKNKLITSSIPIAPDGNVPNSIVESKIEKFRDTHKDYRVDKVEIVSYVKKGVTVMTSVEEDRLQKKENYKMKLKEMMDKRNDAKEQENERLEEIARFEALKQLDILRAKELETARIEEEKRKLLEEQRKRAEAQALKLTEAYGANLAAAATRPKSRASTPNKSRPGTKSAKKSRLQTPEAIARVIEQARDQEWFPINEIYINDEPDDSPYAGLRKPKLKIDATIEALLPFALKVFESKETENVTKVKILNYIDDMQDEYGYLSIVPITTVFSNYLLRNIHEPIESNEIDFRFRIMDSWIQLESNLDIIVILFIYLILGSPLLQQASLDFLTNDFKFKNPDSIYIKERIEDVYAENPASTDYFEQVIAPSIASRDKSIEKVDRLLSVLNLIPNKEEADKRIQDCNNIDISTASLPSNSTDALKSNVMRMFRNIIKDFLVANVADKSIAEEVYNLTPFGNPCSIFLQLPAEASLLNTQNTKTKKAITKKALDKAAETLDEIIAKRNPIEILKTPFVEDLEEAVNFYTVYCETNRNKKQALYEQALIKIALDEEKRLAHEEIKRQELIKLALRNEEKERIEKEKELKLAKIKAMAITEKPDVKIWSKGKQTKTVEEFLAPKPKRPIDANRLDGAFNPTIAKNTLPKARIRLDPFDQGVRDSQVLKFEAMIDNEWLQKTLLEEGQDLTANKQISVFTTNLKYFVP